MNWRDAFLRQARSDQMVMDRLNAPGVAYCHRLHYLQMVSEKLAKALLCRSDDAASPPRTHIALVRMLQVLKSRHDVRRKLGFTEATIFKRYVDSLLDLAARIEGLAPALAGLHQPNPEYPWEDQTIHRVIAPADFAFADFDPKKPAMLKLQQLLRDLFRAAG
jgi:hypothetical protein